MITRRQFLKASAAACAASAIAAVSRASERSSYQVYLPLVHAPSAPPTDTPLPPTSVPPPPPGDDSLPQILDDAPIVGPATGTDVMAINWFVPRADRSYTAFDIGAIVGAYRSIGEMVGIDWFLALAQMAHETGHLTSFWSLRPQRNPAGIGVTGEWRADPPPDREGWAYNTQRQRWERGISFPTWAEHAVPAHLGRLLAYALTDAQANDAQRELIATALAVRPLSPTLRGVAPTILGLNGRWAVPGTTYGQSIVALARRMRYGPATLDLSAPADEDGDVMHEGS
ncbi:glucosaminidase domain-containing protein [Roseiflexus sp.]|uniref:glucosaminidase domain-containing protein n=1 Tax=Roseiflexus sp. TaxID=2562120 RepID=UPI00398AFB67